MFSFLKNLREQGVASPYGAVLFASAVFLVAWLFPPNIYSLYLQEPDYIFLDVLSLVYFFLCAASFILGMQALRLINPAPWSRPSPRQDTDSPFLYICIPLAAGAIACVITLIEYGAHVNFIALLASQQGETIKEVGKGGKGLIQGFWAKAPVFLTGVLWWTQFRLHQLRLSRAARIFLSILWFLGFALDTFTHVAMVDRTGLTPLLLGSGLIYLHGKQSTGRLKLKGAILYAWIGGGGVLAVFLAIAFLRGNSAADLLVSSLLGYSMSQYNRLSAVLHGQMHYFYGGRGAYLFTYLQQAYQVDKIFPVLTALNWPTKRQIYNSEFASVVLAGLNNRYNPSGVFGYLYADIGWGAPIYLFCTGIFAGYLWIRLKAGSAAAIVMYQWVVCWVLLWNTWNLLFNDDFVHLIPVAICLAIWDRLLLNTRAATQSVAIPEIYAHAP